MVVAKQLRGIIYKSRLYWIWIIPTICGEFLVLGDVLEMDLGDSAFPGLTARRGRPTFLGRILGRSILLIAFLPRRFLEALQLHLLLKKQRKYLNITYRGWFLKTKKKNYKSKPEAKLAKISKCYASSDHGQSFQIYHNFKLNLCMKVKTMVVMVITSSSPFLAISVSCDICSTQESALF